MEGIFGRDTVNYLVGDSLHVVFGPFTFHLQTLELTKFGTNLPLEEKPARILVRLIKDHGKVVSRQELQQHLWDDGVNIDFDHGLNKAVNKLRTVLGDSASQPRYLETLSRRGYRFIGEIEFAPAKEPGNGASLAALGSDLSGSGANVNSSIPGNGKIRDLQAAPEASHEADRLPPPPVASAARSRTWMAVSLLGLLCGLVLIVALGLARRPPLPSHQRLTYDDGIVHSARFSPDGDMIVYAAEWNGEPSRLFWTREGSKESSRFELPDSDILSVSRVGDMAILLDPKWRWGFQRTGTLAVVPVTGGSPRKVLDDVQDADWSPDGASLAVSHVVGSACILEFPVGHEIYKGNNWISNLRLSPHGDLVAFFEHPIAGNDSGSVVVMDLAGQKKSLWEGWSGLGGLAWAPNGKSVWFSGYRNGGQKQVYELALSGEHRMVFRESGNVKLHDISRDGRVLLSVDDLRSKTFLHSKGETHARDISLLDVSYATGLSRDGRTVLMDAWGDAVTQKEDEAYLLKIGDMPVRLGVGRPWEISPDGKSVLAVTPLTTSGHSNRQLMLLPIGPGQPETLTQDTIIHSFAAWTPNGNRIVFVGHEPGRPPRSWVQNIGGGSPQPITPEGVSGWVVSPDGKTLVAKDEHQVFWLYPIDGGAPRRLDGPESSDLPARWSDDRRYLFLSTDTTQLPVQVYRLDLQTGRKEIWYALAPADRAGFFGTGPIQITPDGKECVNSYMSMHSVLYLARGIR